MRMQQDEFIAAFGGIFERSAWIAQTVWDEGISEADGEIARLHRRMCDVLFAADETRQDELIAAHPELAAPANRCNDIAVASRREQKNAGLDDMNEQEAAELAQLNRRYREKFGFPFIIAVAGLDKNAVLAALKERLAGEYDDERRNALREICVIAQRRLQQL